MTLIQGVRQKLIDITNNEMFKQAGRYQKKFFCFVFNIIYIFGYSHLEKSHTYKAYYVFVRMLISFIILGEVLFMLTEPFTLDNMINCLSVLIIHYIADLKYYFIMMNANVYKVLLLSMDTMVYTRAAKNRKEIINKYESINRKTLICITILATCTLITWYIFPIIDNVEYNFHVEIKLPFNYKTMNVYLPLFTFELIAFHFISYYVVVNDLFIICLIIFTVCQFEVLSDCLRCVLKESKQEAVLLTNGKLNMAKVKHNFYLQFNSDNTQKQIEYIICKYNFSEYIYLHQKLLNNARVLQDVLSKPMLVQLGGSILLICFVAYQFTSSSNNAAKLPMILQYLTYTIVILLAICWWCNQLTIQKKIDIDGLEQRPIILVLKINLKVIYLQSLSVIDSIYVNGWCERDDDFNFDKDILFIMLRAKKTVVLSAGHSFQISCSLFLKVIKFSYSVLTLLLRMKWKPQAHRDQL